MRTTLLALLVLAPASALASGYEVINVSPRDLALSSSAVAAQEDAGATFVNPSALSRLDGLSLNLAGSVLSIATDWSAPSGSSLGPDASTNFEPTTPIALYAAWGTRVAGRGFGVGIGVGTPFGGNVFWDADWAGRGSIITVQRRFFGGYVTAGLEVIPEILRLGGGLVSYYGFEYLRQGVPPFAGAQARLDTDGGGGSYDVSAELTPLRGVPLSIGIDYKHKATVEMEGDADFEVPAGVAVTNVDQGARHVLTLPNQLAVGAAYRVTPPLLLTLQWSFSRWSVYDADVFEGDRGLTITVPRDYRNGYVIRGGGEYDVSDAFTVRAGLMFDNSGFRTERYSPTLPDADTWGFSAGIGWNARRDLALNVTGFYGVRDDVTTTNNATVANPEGTFPGRFETDVWIASVGVVWRRASR
jgi:long-chain fatty acid transport protein